MKGILPFVIPAFFITILFGVAGSGLIALASKYLMGTIINMTIKLLIASVGLIIVIIFLRKALSGQVETGKTFAYSMLAVVIISVLLIVLNKNMAIYSITYIPATQSIISGSTLTIGGWSIDLGILAIGIIANIIAEKMIK